MSNPKENLSDDSSFLVSAKRRYNIGEEDLSFRQALFVEQAIPSSSSFNTANSASIPCMDILILLGTYLSHLRSIRLRYFLLNFFIK